jgi:hypothetical protein
MARTSCPVENAYCCPLAECSYVHKSYTEQCELCLERELFEREAVARAINGDTTLPDDSSAGGEVNQEEGMELVHDLNVTFSDLVNIRGGKELDCGRRVHNQSDQPVGHCYTRSNSRAGRGRRRLGSIAE